MNKNLWALGIGVPGALLVSAAVVFLPPFWLTAAVGAGVFLFTLSNPTLGLIMLLALLQFSVFPQVQVGPLEFSPTTVPIIGLAMGAWIRQRNGMQPGLGKLSQSLLLLVAGAFLLATLASSDYAETLSVLPNLMLYVLILYGVMSAVNQPAQLVPLAKTIVALTVVAIFWNDLRPLRGLVGIKSLGINGMIFGLYPAMGICLTLAAKPIVGFTWRWRWFALGALGAMAWRIITYEARAGALAGLVLLGVAAIVHRAFLKPLYIFALLVVLLLANVFFQDIVRTNLIKTDATFEASLSADDPTGRIDKADQLRLVSTDAALRMFSARPLTGWGPNLYVTLKPSFAVGPQYLFGSRTVGAFNAWALTLAELGLLGILATGTMVIAPAVISLYALRKYHDDLARLAFGFALGVIGLSIHLFFIDLFYSLVWTQIALALAAAQLSWHAADRALVPAARAARAVDWAGTLATPQGAPE